MITKLLQPGSDIPSGTYTLTIYCASGACQTSLSNVVYTAPAFPDWLSARYSYNATTSKLDVEAYSTVEGDTVQIKLDRMDGEPIVAQSSTARERKQGVFYLPQTLPGQRPYTMAWTFQNTGASGSGITQAPLGITFKQVGSSKTFTYFLNPPQESIRSVLFAATPKPVTPSSFWQQVADGSETVISSSITGAVTLTAGKKAKYRYIEVVSGPAKRLYKGSISWSIVGTAPAGVTLNNSTGALYHGGFSSVNALTPLTIQAQAGSTTKQFTLNLTPLATVNKAPVLVNPNGNVDVTVPEDFSFTLSEDQFFDLSDSLTLTAVNYDGNAPLPAWVTFNPATRTFSIPKAKLQMQGLLVRVIATDTAGATAQDLILLTVNRPKIKFISRAVDTNGNIIYWVRGMGLSTNDLYRLQERHLPASSSSGAVWSNWNTIPVIGFQATTDPLGDLSYNLPAGTASQQEFRMVKLADGSIIDTQSTFHYDYPVPASPVAPANLFTSNS